MAEVGSAFVSILPSARGFGSKLNSEIGGDLDSAGKSAGSRFGNALKVGALAVVGAGVLAGKFLSSALDEAREAQVITARTENVIKSMGLASKVSASQVADLAAAISAKTGIDDEAIQSGQNLLLTFKNVARDAGVAGGVFEQTSRLMVDLSAAMGTDAKGAAIQLGKALNDPVKGITALTRVGVSFTEGQKKTIAALVETGDTMGAQKVILGELKKQFGGAAEAMATPADKARVAWGNFKEQIGTALLPVVDKVLNAFVKAGPQISAFITDKVGPALQRVIEFGSDLVARASTWGPAIAESFGWVIDAGKSLAPVLRAAVDLAQLGVAAFGAIPGPMKEIGIQVAIAALVFPRLAAGVGMAGGAFANAKTNALGFAAEMRNAETRSARLQSVTKSLAGVGGLALLASAANDAEGGMKDLKQTAGLTALAFGAAGPWAGAVTAFVSIVGRAKGAGEDFGMSQEDVARQIDLVTESLNQQSGAFTRRTREMVVSTLGEQGILSGLNEMGIALPQVTRAVMDGAEGVEHFRDKYLTMLPADQRAKFVDFTETMYDLSGAVLSGQEGFALHRDAMGKTGEVAQQRREDIQRYAKSFDLVPSAVRTIVKAMGTDDSQRNVRALAKQYDTTPRIVKTLFQVLGASKAKGEAKGTQRALEDVGKVPGNLDKWLAGIGTGLRRGRDQAGKGGRDVRDGIERPIKDTKANLTTLMGGIATGLTKASSQGRSQATGAGANITRGLAAGIGSSSAVAAVIAAARSAVRQAINAAKSEAQIKSPSRETAELGRYLSEGLAVGIAAAAPNATQAAVNLAERVLEKFKTLRDGIKSRVDEIKSDMASLSSSVASAFTGNLFEATDTQGFMANLMDTKGQLKELKSAFRKLVKWGLSPQFLSQLFSSGNGGLILDLAASGNRGWAMEAAQTFGQVQSLSNQLGGQVAQNQYGDELRKQTDRLERIEKAVKNIGRDVGKELNGAASTAQRRAS